MSQLNHRQITVDTCCSIEYCHLDPAHPETFLPPASEKSFISPQWEHAGGTQRQRGDPGDVWFNSPWSGCLNADPSREGEGFNIWDKLTSLTKAKLFPLLR